MILDDFFWRIRAFLISDYAVVNVIPRTSPIEISMVDNPVHADHAVLLWEKHTMSGADHQSGDHLTVDVVRDQWSHCETSQQLTSFLVHPGCMSQLVLRNSTQYGKICCRMSASGIWPPPDRESREFSSRR